MTNHIHLIVVPASDESLGRALGQAHQRYSAVINAQHGWTGNLWANRFHSSAMDDERLWTAVRYVKLNPVRAGMVERATDYTWSSARAHAGMTPPHDLLSDKRPFPGLETDWGAFLAQGVSSTEAEQLRINTSTGRPTGSAEFVKNLEQEHGRSFVPQKRGPKSAAVSEPDLTSDLFG